MKRPADCTHTVQYYILKTNMQIFKNVVTDKYFVRVEQEKFTLSILGVQLFCIGNHMMQFGINKHK